MTGSAGTVETAYDFRILPEGRVRDALSETLEAQRWVRAPDHAGNVCLLVADWRDIADGGEALVEGQAARAMSFLAIAKDLDQAESALAAGATQILIAPFDDDALEAQLRLARRSVDRARSAANGTDRQEAAYLSTLDDWLGQKGASHHDAAVHGMLIGLRRLEAINATYGNAVGDEVLSDIGTRMRDDVARHAPSGSLCQRLRGGEFLIACRMEQDRAGWAGLAEQLLDRLAVPLRSAGHQLRITGRASLAIAKAEEDYMSFVDRLASGLEAARGSEGLSYRWADRTADGSPAGGYRLEQDVVRAVDRGEIAVVYQPQFNVADGTLTGAEALVRWQHPDMGEIGAGTLFALAEKADYIQPLSRHIRVTALEQAVRWPASMRDLRLSLNVTAQDLSESDFATAELQRLERTGFALDRITLEITESALIPNVAHAGQLFAALRARGLSIAIDDFGTGYSNLLYLKSLPLDYLKMDHAMSHDIVGDGRDRIIVRSIIALARALDLKTIAEGIETEEQLAALADEGCDFFQGFLRGRAMSDVAFQAFATA